MKRMGNEKRWKQILSCLLAFALLCSMLGIYAGTNAKASTDAKPDAYFDLNLDLDADKISNTGTNQNTTITSVGSGTLETMSVIYKGKVCKVPVYSVAEDGTNNSYLDVHFKDITNETDMKNWIFNTGITFECFIWVDGTTVSSTAGIMTSMNSGGIGLCSIKNAGGTNFQIGTTDQTTAGIKYGSRYAASNTNTAANALDVGKLTHIVGTYDHATNMMAYYKNGELIGTATFGNGSFRLGSATAGHIGIGTNIAYLTESLDDEVSYKVAGARVYSGALTAAQVKEEYDNRWEEVFSYADAGYDGEVQLDDVSVYDSVTGTSQTLSDGVPAYIYETGLGSYIGCFDGESTNPGVADSKTYVFETSDSTYLSYLKSLEEAGWEQYSNNIIEGKNLFATYTKGDKSIYAYFIANTSRVSIIVSDTCVLENR